MDIKNIFDFESRIDFLNNNSSTNHILESQGRYLNSNTLNNNFKIIENSLNSMYEKIRVLEEVIHYANVYINNEIEDVVTECRKTLKDIENITDANFEDNKNFTAINILLINNDNAQYVDRDGSPLKTCQIYNNVISLSGVTKDQYSFNSIEVQSNEQNYCNNAHELAGGKTYRTRYYLLDKPKNNIQEVITLNLKKAEEVNSIKLKLSNCDLKSIIYIYEDNTRVIDNDMLTGAIPSQKVKAIQLHLESKNCKIEKIEMHTTNQNHFEDFIKNKSEKIDNIKQHNELLNKKEYIKTTSKNLEDIYIRKES